MPRDVVLYGVALFGFVLALLVATGTSVGPVIGIAFALLFVSMMSARRFLGGWIQTDATGLRSNLWPTKFPRYIRWSDILDYTLARAEGDGRVTWELTIWTTTASYSVIGESEADEKSLAAVLHRELPHLGIEMRAKQTTFNWS